MIHYLIKFNLMKPMCGSSLRHQFEALGFELSTPLIESLIYNPEAQAAPPSRAQAPVKYNFQS